METKRMGIEEKELEDDAKLILEELERVEKLGTCDCNSKYCFHNKVFDVRRKCGVTLEKMAELIALVENHTREEFSKEMEKSLAGWQEEVSGNEGNE